MILLIGAGGIGGHLYAHFAQTGAEICVMDGDVVEQGNLERQLFSAQDVGENKARALTKGAHPYVAAYLTEDLARMMHVPEYLQITAIFVAVDNHTARRRSLALSDQMGVPCILCGNETNDADAMVYLPEWAVTQWDPRIYIPELLNVTDHHDPLRSCTANRTVSRQTRLANLLAATLGLELFTIWRNFTAIQGDLTPGECYRAKGRLPIRIQWVNGRFTHHTFLEEKNDDLT